MAHAVRRPALARFIVRLLLPAWVAGMALPAWAENASRWPKLEEVIVVSKTHFDIGFTDLASRVVDRYRTSMADQALKLVDESRGLPPDRQFAWTLAGWPMSQVLWPGQAGERRDRFVAAMRAGRLVPHALAFTTHTESLDLEDLTRGFRFSVEMARLAGQPLPTGCKMTDVPDHTRGLATVLANAGVKFFHHGCNDNCTAADLPELYWWEGPDGSRVLTALSRTYGSDLCPPAGWPYKTWLCMWMTYDNQGPPNTKMVEALFARAKRDLPGVRVRFGQLSDFADAILREKPDLPVVRGDTPDTWIYGIGSMPIETQLAHATRPRIAVLESLDTLLRTWGVPTEPAAKIVRDAYENTLLFGEHTWGPDVARYAGYSYGDDWKKKLAAGQYRFLLEGFDQKRAYAHRAAELIEPAIQKRMAALAKAVAEPGRRIVVFNPLPWTRDGAVEVPWTGTTMALTDVANRETVAAQSGEGILRFTARNLPPLGYRTFVPAQGASQGNVTADAKAQCLENEFLRVTLDPARCGIKSIVDKRSGRELVNTQSPYALGQYLYERFDVDQGLRHAHDYVTFRPKQDPGEIGCQSKPHLPSAKEHPYSAATATDAIVEISRGATSASALFKAAPHGIIPDATQLRVTLYTGQPWLDLEWSIANKTPDPWPEGGWLCFPLRAEAPTFRLARLGSIVDPAKDLVRSSNHDLFCLNGGLTVEGADGSRTGICPIDAQLVSLERRGLWQYSRDFVAHKPDVFVALFNNLYSTNFAQWIEGSWSSRVRLWPIDKQESTASSLIANSWEARVACLAAVSDGPPGKLPSQAAGLAVEKPANRKAVGISSRGPLVTAFGANPYGEGTLLRLWEQAGDGGDFTVRLPRGMDAATAEPCDLRGQPTGPPIPVSVEGVFSAKIRSMAPASFILLASCTGKSAAADPSPAPGRWLTATPEKLPRWRGFNLLEKFYVSSNRRPFLEQDFRLISRLGFNFVRLPMDYRCWIRGGNWEEFDEATLAQIDQAVAWGEKYGIHVCINFHRAPGYTVARPPERTNLWTDPEAQRVCTKHWAMFARRYQGIPSERLSFNLMNEPGQVDPKLYVAVVTKLARAIRGEDPKRLIIADGLKWGTVPVPQLREIHIAQATRGYTPMEISHYKASWVGGEKFPPPQWPRLLPTSGTLLGPAKKEHSYPLTIDGPFASATELRLHVLTVSTLAHLVVEADGKPVFQKRFTSGPGKGEWKKAEYKPQWKVYQNLYDRDYETTIPALTRQVRIRVTEGDWLEIGQIGLKPTGAAKEAVVDLKTEYCKMPAPFHFAPGMPGGPIVGLPVQDRAWLWEQCIEPWKELERQGTGVMVGEWGVYNRTPHDVVLRWAEDCLANWQKAGWGWAMWNFRGSMGVLDSERSDVRYEDFEGHKLDRRFMDLLQRY